MTPVVPAVGAAMIIVGLMGLVVGLTPQQARAAAPRRREIPRRVTVSRKTMALLAGGAVVGAVIALLTGWLVAVVLVPVAVAGLPFLLSDDGAQQRIRRLDAMEEWVRSLSGVLTAGAGLEQALIATLRSVPAPVNPEVTRLVARLRARWSTEAALRALADELDDATGDLIVANLILGTRRRGAGLAGVLEGLAESVAADVRARRQIEADRAKPRTTARWVTIITVGVLVALGMTGTYIAPYGSGIGQLLLGALLACYAGVFVWMRRMAAGKPLPRFIGTQASKEATR
jgi:tight adherence protein B